MSGPALTQLHAHRSIHDAAHGEAEELTQAARGFAAAGQEQAARATVALLLEHWHDRTLRHAAEEEAGLYLDVAAQSPERALDIAALTRDHDLMRQLVAEVEVHLEQEAPMAGILDRFDMLLWLVEAHSREEEKRLLDTEPDDLD